VLTIVIRGGHVIIDLAFKYIPMKNAILVTTDFSVNSKAGIRFAIAMARQTRQSLIFYHCLPYLRPSRWSDERYELYASQEKERSVRQLQKFVLDIYRTSGVVKPQFECVVEQKSDVVNAIIAFAKSNGVAAVCMSTRGAGRLKKLIGNHASEIIRKSGLPVFVVPRTYRRSAINHVLYASDLNNIAEELALVRDFALPFKAKISVLHYDYLADVKEAQEKLEAVARKHRSSKVDFQFRKLNIDKPLAQHLIKDIRALRASIAVLFTDQKRGWFDKLFLSSKTVDVAYNAATPLLVYPKN
jgi:nucleotide-binding universal stress UspA family protein